LELGTWKEDRGEMEGGGRRKEEGGMKEGGIKIDM
jgi:hypothetical protein